MARRVKRSVRLFLSHSSRDQRFVHRLHLELRQHGIESWYSEVHIAGGRQWHDEIGKARQECNWFVVVLTPSAVKSRWVKRELLFALNQPQYDNRIVPLLRQPCDMNGLSWTLSSFQTVDVRRDVASDGISELARLVRR
ncbi:MAG: toll/interleukin-1 receptor domain-containing protein [Phycisphaeraceae bacterium]|nr:toll/interleukin-1 receptor domain-containing protein [Phycisphaeraceae bacterium]